MEGQFNGAVLGGQGVERARFEREGRFQGEFRENGENVAARGRFENAERFRAALIGDRGKEGGVENVV